MISVTEFLNGTCDLHDQEANHWYRGVALADLPDFLRALNVDPRPLSREEQAWVKLLEHYRRYPGIYEFDPDLQGVLSQAHRYLAAQLFRNWIATRIIKGSMSSVKVAFEAATGRYAGGLTRIRELLQEARFEIDNQDRIHSPRHLPVRKKHSPRLPS
ncbi:MAG: hypothetical protein ABSG68_23985 [Thermoguttaceae bacterium]|jgi:hypothetical protein